MPAPVERYHGDRAPPDHNFWADWLPPFPLDHESALLLGYEPEYVRPRGGDAYRIIGFDDG